MKNENLCNKYNEILNSLKTDINNLEDNIDKLVGCVFILGIILGMLFLILFKIIGG